MINQQQLVFYIFLLPLVIAGVPAWAQTTIPGPAQADRLEADPEKLLPPEKIPDVSIPKGGKVSPKIPPAAEAITFKLEKVNVVGVTAFSQEELRKMYVHLLGKEIALSRVWALAGRVTERYRSSGFFLSRAYVPAQEIIDGVITIKVLEGYIGDIELAQSQKTSSVLKQIFHNITHEKPISIKTLEKNLLLLNDIPGMRFEAVLKPDEDISEGVARLLLIKEKVAGRGSLSFNNHGSRFTGPFHLTSAYESSFIPLHKTSISGIADLPTARDLSAFTLRHEAQVMPQTSLFATISHTKSEPGFNLDPFNIESKSLSWSVGARKKIIRQRRANLEAGLSVEFRNSDTDILATPNTSDRIRALRAKLKYSTPDPYGGQNSANLILSQGLSAFGASDKDDANISRASANPDFTKVNITWRRSQVVAPKLTLLTTLSGQKASGSLYASEEFGFGGPDLGRAYDTSEILGDDGVAIGLEMHYTGLGLIKKGVLTPYAFYDFGRIWNQSTGQVNGLSASSAGVGANYQHPSGLNASISIAQPIVKSIQTPPFGGSDNAPRAFFQLSYFF
mgnify:CR=1 FL=1